VVWVDRDRRTEHRTKAGLVFLCASTLESTRLLLLSRSGRHPEGLGAASGVLGRYLMDHVWLKAQGFAPRGLPSGTPIETGRCLYLPRFDARDRPFPAPGRGYGVQLYYLPLSERRSYFVASAFAEMPPRPENRVTLDQQQRDAWGIPALRIDYRLGETPHAADQHAVLQSLGGLLDVEFTSLDEAPRPPGSAMHECGTARMGSDPDNSVLDPFNQCWAARGLYVTDGACFPSQGSQNPTLTIMALTARACDHALRDRRRGA
jgi:choline dehydrogenase-like flavoprotein